MKTKSIIANVAIALTLGILYTSCSKTKDPLTVDTDTQSATDNSTADNSFSGIFKSLNEIADTSSDLKSLGCPTITKTPTVGTVGGFPKTLIINYGTIGCNDHRGQITAVLTGPWNTSGSKLTVTTQDYYDGLNKIDAGTHTITNNGLNAASHVSFTIDVAGASITTPTGVISWSTTRTIEQTAGASTPMDHSDDVYSITGSSSGKSVNGATFTANIESPLIVAVSCKWIESGVITLTPAGKTARKIDFGSTGCDNDATVTIAGKAIAIKL